MPQKILSFCKILLDRPDLNLLRCETSHQISNPNTFTAELITFLTLKWFLMSQSYIIIGVSTLGARTPGTKRLFSMKPSMDPKYSSTPRLVTKTVYLDRYAEANIK